VSLHLVARHGLGYHWASLSIHVDAQVLQALGWLNVGILILIFLEELHSLVRHYLSTEHLILHNIVSALCRTEERAICCYHLLSRLVLLFMLVPWRSRVCEEFGQSDLSWLLAWYLLEWRLLSSLEHLSESQLTDRVLLAVVNGSFILRLFHVHCLLYHQVVEILTREWWRLFEHRTFFQNTLYFVN